MQVTASQHGRRRKHAADAVHMLRRFEETAKAAPPERLSGHWHNQRGHRSLDDHMKHRQTAKTRGRGRLLKAPTHGRLLKAPQPANTHGRLLHPA